MGVRVMPGSARSPLPDQATVPAPAARCRSAVTAPRCIAVTRSPFRPGAARRPPAAQPGKSSSETASSRVMATVTGLVQGRVQLDRTGRHHHAPSAQEARQLFQHRRFGLPGRQATGGVSPVFDNPCDQPSGATGPRIRMTLTPFACYTPTNQPPCEQRAHLPRSPS
jgi:hypothetical protein